MSFLENLFKGRSATGIAGGATTSSSTLSKRGSNWYFAQDKSRALRQVVLNADPEHKTKSRFSSRACLVYPRMFSELMNASPLATGLFRLDGDPGPYLLIRTDGTFGDGAELVDFMSNSKFRVAFTFAYLPTSGLVGIFVSGGTLQMFSQKGFLERVYGLDESETRDLIADALSKEALHLVLAGDSGSKYDIEIPLDSSCKQLLVEEWKTVLAHHRRISRPDFQTAGRRLYQLMPEGSDPVFDDNAS
jgi:hypothetical protein